MSASSFEGLAPSTPDAMAQPAGPTAAARDEVTGAVQARGWVPRAYDALVLLWVALFHHVLGVKYRFAQIGYDEHFFLNEGWSVLKGQVPYNDFQEFKPPFIFVANWLGLELFGLEGLGYRKLLALLSLASFLLFTVALLSRGVQRLVVVAVAMLTINHFYDDGLHAGVINDAETLALDGFLLGTGALLIKTRWQRTQWLLGGALLSLSPLSKEPMAFGVTAAWLSILLLQRSESNEPGFIRRYVLYTVGGVVAVLAVWLAYMLATASLSWYILQLKLSFAYAENYAYQLKWASRTPKGGVLGNALWKLAKGYVNPAHFAVLVPFFVALALRTRLPRSVRIGAIVTFAAGLYAVTIGGGFSPRYYIMGMTGTCFCVGLGAIALDDYVARRGYRLRGALACLGLALVTTLPRFGEEVGKYSSYEPPPIPVPQSEIDFVLQRTSPGDKIFTTDDPLLYVYTDRPSAFRGGIVLDEIIDYYPGDTDEERLAIIRDGLEETRPKLVLLGNTMWGVRRKQRYLKALVMPFLRENNYIQLNERAYLRPD